MSKKYYFFIEPYVEICIKNSVAILYNTLNGQHFHIKHDLSIIRLLKKIKSKKNLYVIELQLRDKNIIDFIAKSKEMYIGDMIKKSQNSLKPTQQMPILNVQNDINRISDKNGLNIITYLSKINFRLNELSGNSLLNTQFTFCHPTFNFDKEIDFEKIDQLINTTDVYNINLSGSNIFQYSHFKQLIDLLGNKNIATNFYANYQNPDITPENLQKLKNINAQLNISVSLPLNIENLQKTKKIIDKTGISHSFDFKIENETDIEVFENAITRLNIENYSFHPYYNGNNIELFEQAVYLTKEDIFAAKPTQKDIFARQVINQLNFGKLYILPDGSVYSNLNKAKLGNLHKHSIHELVHKEMYKHKNWFKLRKNVKPCRSCVYNLLCPPISNYEYAIGKYNLCHVWKEN